MNSHSKVRGNLWDRRALSVVLVAVFGAVLLITPTAGSHCDSMGGPVIADAIRALESGDVTPTLKWVAPEDEGAIHKAFDECLAVRKASPEAAALADRYFYETLVRVHRASEGEPFTGLKPADAVEPGIKAADEAVAGGSAEELSEQVAHAMMEKIRTLFTEVQERKAHQDESVEAGRAYVHAYVQFIHYVETLEKLAVSGGRSTHDDQAGQHQGH